MNAIHIAAKGLRASMMRWIASASNMANANSVGAPQTSAPNDTITVDPAAYQPIIATQQTATDSVVANYSRPRPASTLRHDPSSSAADSSGYVSVRNANVADEGVQQTDAQSDFDLNVAVTKVADHMQRDRHDGLSSHPLVARRFLEVPGRADLPVTMFDLRVTIWGAKAATSNDAGVASPTTGWSRSRLRIVDALATSALA